MSDYLFEDNIGDSIERFYMKLENYPENDIHDILCDFVLWDNWNLE